MSKERYERPYVSRPSRSQQFQNPKLVPKLTNETLNPLEKKKGVADEELAKAEAERARKREREERDDELIESSAKRHRSVSSHSVSTISTGASRSPSPDKDRARSPFHARRGRSPYSDAEPDSRGGGRDDSRSRSRSLSSNRSRSPRVEPQRRRSVSGDSRSPEGYDRRDQYRSRDPLPPVKESGTAKRVQMGLGDNALVVRGPPSPEEGAMRGQTGPTLDMTVRERLLEGGLMGEDMIAEIRLLKSNRESEV
ncbi:hypothetical protein ACHAPJ_005374 [Fusarium lateritium]